MLLGKIEIYINNLEINLINNIYNKYWNNKELSINMKILNRTFLMLECKMEISIKLKIYYLKNKIT
jgi:hypothetical protein